MSLRIPSEFFLDLQQGEVLTLSQVSNLDELVQVSLVIEIEPKAYPPGPVQKPDSYVMVDGRGVEIGCLAQLSEFVARPAGIRFTSLHVLSALASLYGEFWGYPGDSSGAMNDL